MKKMKVTPYITLLACFAIVFASCKKTETFDNSWKISNEQQFEKIANDPSYTRIISKSGKGFIMYKELKKGEDKSKSPYFTDQVKVLYSGWYKKDWEKDDILTTDDGNVFHNKTIFLPQGDAHNIPRVLSISSYKTIDGLKTALQHMHVGDKWEIWIPSELAYGAYEQNNIRGYTTVVFEVELLEIL